MVPEGIDEPSVCHYAVALIGGLKAKLIFSSQSDAGILSSSPFTDRNWYNKASDMTKCVFEEYMSLVHDKQYAQSYLWFSNMTVTSKTVSV